MILRTRNKTILWSSYGDGAFRRGLVISSAVHMGLLLAIVLVESLRPASSPLLLAGGQNVGGPAMEVGVVGASEWFRLRRELDVDDFDQQSPPVRSAEDNMKPSPESSLELLPERKRTPPPEAPDRPPNSETDRPHPRRKAAGAASARAPIDGAWSPSPGTLSGGVGIALDRSTPAGIPAGSEYGRRLQQALVSYYRLTPNGQTPRYVIVRIRIARSGHILSIEGGRLRPEAFIRRSGNIVVDTRVVAALLELDRHPIPFPPDFLPGVSEAVVEIYFQY